MRVAALVMLSVLLPRPAAAADCHVAQQAYATGDYATALAQWRELADEGHAHSQLMIGTLYFNGEGVKQDYAEAVRRFRLAADNGDADAALQLSVMYAKGKGVAQDAARAQHWSVRAAELAEHDGIECHEGSRGDSKK